jgi:lambda family phage portal protein
MANTPDFISRSYPAPKWALNAKRVAAPARPAVRATRYDMANPSQQNAKHFAMRDGLSAAASLNPSVRRRIRESARYEVANNSYAIGVLSTLSNDVIGSGPRLQMLTKDAVFNERLEKFWGEWSREVQFAKKLRTGRVAKGQDGEMCGRLVNNPNVAHPVKLDVLLLESERVASPAQSLVTGFDPGDGIVYDQFERPVSYTVLSASAGDGSGEPVVATTVPARAMLHVFKQLRPGQLRGVSELTQALPLFAQLRRLTSATLTAAESVASMAMWLKSTSLDVNDPAQLDPMDEFELAHGMVTTLPEGWDVGQLDPRQPSANYKEFKHEILNEIARSLDMPFNIAAGNSSDYSFASGRLDHQMYYKAVDVERDQWESDAVDKTFKEFMQEAVLVADMIPPQFRNPRTWLHAWHWPGREHVDQAKQAAAWAIELANGTITLADIYASKGQDWQHALAQRGLELKEMDKQGIPMPASMGGADNDAGSTDPAKPNANASAQHNLTALLKLLVAAEKA